MPIWQLPPIAKVIATTIGNTPQPETQRKGLCEIFSLSYYSMLLLLRQAYLSDLLQSYRRKPRLEPHKAVHPGPI
jgi:hypothetical protein